MHPYWWVRGAFKRSAPDCSSIAASQVGDFTLTVAMLVSRKHCSIIIRTSKTLHSLSLSPPLPPTPSLGLKWPPSPSLLSVVNLNTGRFILPCRCLFYNERSSSFVRGHKRDHHRGRGQRIRQTDKWTDGHGDGRRCAGPAGARDAGVRRNESEIRR